MPAGSLISAHHASRKSSAIITYLCEVFQRPLLVRIRETHVLVLVHIWRTRMVRDGGTVLAYHAVRYIAFLRSVQHCQVARHQTSAVLQCQGCILAVRHAILAWALGVDLHNITQGRITGRSVRNLWNKTAAPVRSRVGGVFLPPLCFLHVILHPGLSWFVLG